MCAGSGRRLSLPKPFNVRMQPRDLLGEPPAMRAVLVRIDPAVFQCVVFALEVSDLALKPCVLLDDTFALHGALSHASLDQAPFSSGEKARSTSRW